MTDKNVDLKKLNPEGAGELANESSASAQGHHDGDGVGGDMALGGVDITPDRIHALLIHLRTLYVAYLGGSPPGYDSVSSFLQAFNASSYQQLLTSFPELKFPTVFHPTAQRDASLRVLRRFVRSVGIILTDATDVEYLEWCEPSAFDATRAATAARNFRIQGPPVRAPDAVVRGDSATSSRESSVTVGTGVLPSHQVIDMTDNDASRRLIPPPAMCRLPFDGSGLGPPAGGGGVGLMPQGVVPPTYPLGLSGAAGSGMGSTSWTTGHFPTAAAATLPMGAPCGGGVPSPSSVLCSPTDFRQVLGDPVVQQFVAKASMHVRQLSLRLVHSARERMRLSGNHPTTEVPTDTDRYMDWFHFFCIQRSFGFLLGPPVEVLKTAAEIIQESAQGDLSELVLRQSAPDLAAQMASGGIEVHTNPLAMATMNLVFDSDQQGVAFLSALTLPPQFRNVLEQIRVAPRPSLGATHFSLLYLRLACNNRTQLGSVEELIRKANGFVQTQLKDTGAASVMEWKWRFDNIAGLFLRFGGVWQYATMPATIFLMVLPQGPLRDQCLTRRMIAESGGGACSQETLFATFVQIAHSVDHQQTSAKKTASVNVVEARESIDPKGNSSLITCWHCKKAGHRVQVCPTVGKATAGSDQKIVTGLYCRTCKHLGHKAQLCPSKSSSTNSESSKNDSPPHSRPGVGGAIQP